MSAARCRVAPSSIVVRPLRSRAGKGPALWVKPRTSIFLPGRPNRAISPTSNPRAWFGAPDITIFADVALSCFMSVRFELKTRRPAGAITAIPGLAGRASQPKDMSAVSLRPTGCTIMALICPVVLSDWDRAGKGNMTRTMVTAAIVGRQSHMDLRIFIRFRRSRVSERPFRGRRPPRKGCEINYRSR